MPETNDPDEDEQTVKDSLNLEVRRRDVMKAAGAAGVVSSVGATGVSAQEDGCNTCDSNEPQGSSCFDSVEEDCGFCKVEQVPDIGETCSVDITLPDGSVHTVTYTGADSGDGDDETECITIDDGGGPLNRVALKSGRGCECTVYENPSDGDKLCTLLSDGSQCHKQISHLEFEVCPRPRVTSLAADCFELTIGTADAGGQSIFVDYRLQLEDADGNVTLVDEVDELKVSDDDGDGVYAIDVSGFDDVPWNRVAFDEVRHSDGTDMLAEGGFTAPVIRYTQELCNPPAVLDLATDCSGMLTITTDNVPDTDTLNDLTVTYTLEEIDADCNLVSETVEKTASTEVSGGTATVDLTEGGSVTGWNVVDVSSVVHDASDAEMLDPRPQREIVTVI